MKIEARKDRLHENYLRRKAKGTQKKYEEKYKPKHEAWKAKRIAEMPPSNGITLAETRERKEEQNILIDDEENKKVAV